MYSIYVCQIPYKASRSSLLSFSSSSVLSWTQTCSCLPCRWGPARQGPVGRYGPGLGWDEAWISMRSAFRFTVPNDVFIFFYCKTPCAIRRGWANRLNPPKSCRASCVFVYKYDLRLHGSSGYTWTWTFWRRKDMSK